MRILAVTAEMFPFVKTGGLADAAGALPEALARQGADVRTLLPLYRRLAPLIRGKEPCLAATILEQPVSVYSVVSDGQQLLLLEAADLSTGTAIPMAKKASHFPTTICALRSFPRLQRKSQSVRLTAGSPTSFTHMTGTRP